MRELLVRMGPKRNCLLELIPLGAVIPCSKEKEESCVVVGYCAPLLEDKVEDELSLCDAGPGDPFARRKMREKVVSSATKRKQEREVQTDGAGQGVRACV